MEENRKHRREQHQEEHRQERRQADGLLVYRFSRAADASSWAFSPWHRVPSEAYGGYDLVAARCIAAGEVILREYPLLEAVAPDSDGARGWATAVLKAFCTASVGVRTAVLAITAVGQHEIPAARAYTRMAEDAASEVALCTTLPWRTACPQISDRTLAKVCLIARLNGYEFGDGRTALFTLGCQMNHACDSNVRFSSREHDGRGCFIAARDIAIGESLCTSYLGDMTSAMSTPARRDALLESKLFTCVCPQCCGASDPQRHIPCPGCHTRDAADGALSAAVAFGRGRVRYAHPSSADAGARWLCSDCPSGWSIEEVLPGPRSASGVSGRAWEKVLENNTLHFHERATLQLERGKGLQLLPEATAMHEAVSRNVGCQHWTTRRLAEIMAGASAQAEEAARLAM
jgi:hypothetical protein